jgi:tryptophan synthase alpha chain
MPYVMAGFPDLDSSIRVAHACVSGGCDILELGIPFSDPLADGPVIQAAATRALQQGTTLAASLDVCEAVSGRVPVVLMVYANAVFACGVSRFADRAAKAGACAVIVPDLPYEHSLELREALDSRGLAWVSLVAPNTQPKRAAMLAQSSRGFVYAVSTTGTTGERKQLAPQISETVGRIKCAADIPVAVGFGVSTPDHARTVASLSDGVIVGTRLVRAADEGGPDEVLRVVSELAQGLSLP